MNALSYRAYIKGTLTACSPFLIGCDDNIADKTALRDADGKVFIPGSSLAGILRSKFMERKDEIFGFVKDGKASDSRQSKIFVYDSFLRDKEKPSFSVRDGVRLINKVAVTDEKYVYEVVEPGVSFDCRLEFVQRENDVDDYKGCLHSLIAQMRQGIYLGSKTNRGMGHFVLDNISVYEIDFTKSKDIAYDRYVNFEWDSSKCKFDPFDASLIGKALPVKMDINEETFLYNLNVPSTLLIRSAGVDTPIMSANGKKPVDSVMLRRSDGNAVIPGTSWAGLFRDAGTRILNELGCEQTKKLIDEMFGSSPDVKEHAEKQSSKVAFAESVLTYRDSIPIEKQSFVQTHVKIDRFTQGACDKALYDAQIICGADMQLCIRIINGTPWMKDLLHLIIMDLNDGYLAIGGQVSIGRGICKVKDLKNMSCTNLSQLLISKGGIV